MAAADLRARLLAWFDAHARDLPWRRDPSPYETLVSEVMLQQTRVETVIPYYERWLAAFERLLDRHGLVRADELDSRTAEFEHGERDDVF